ncbi:MAG TPA: RibD family protein, partial [Bacteroidia bacterium]|nr:RibD family protein [Bacteroidia bacterium]
NESKTLVHTWRAQEQAILIGTKTALLDNPALTVRLTEGKSPIRILIDKELKVPFINPIFSDVSAVIVFTEKEEEDANNITYHQIDFAKDVVSQILNYLYEKKITSIIIEGGAKTLQAFIDKDLWDEARIFTGNKCFKAGIKAPFINRNKSSTQMIGDDELSVLTQ